MLTPQAAVGRPGGARKRGIRQHDVMSVVKIAETQNSPVNSEMGVDFSDFVLLNRSRDLEKRNPGVGIAMQGVRFSFFTIP